MLNKNLLKSGSGFLPLNKPPGITSFDAIRQVKKTLGLKKIGHTGTLDKFAEGLLILLYGGYTRLASLFLGQDKEYTAVLRLGETTETLDPEGAVTERGAIPSLATLKECLPQFTGTISQVPPLFSAVHVNGQRAYKLARQGQNPVLKPRDITIYKLSIIDYAPPYLTLQVLCSKGTYIRSLARDLGQAAGSCAFLQQLKRTAVGNFQLCDAVSLTEILKFDRNFSPRELACSLKGVDALTLREEFKSMLLQGIQPQSHFFTETVDREGEYFVLDKAGNLLAVVCKAGSGFAFRAVLGGQG